MLRTIHLHGAAAELAPTVELDANNVQMLFAGLNSAFKDFKTMFGKCEDFALLKKRADGKYESVTEDTLMMPFGDSTELHLITRAKGADPATAYAVATAMGASGATAVIVAAVIYIAFIVGMSYLAASLAPSPDVGGSEAAANEPSFMFNGAANITEEGYAVPVVYGRVLTGSVVISVGTEVENIVLVQPDTATGSGELPTPVPDNSGGV